MFHICDEGGNKLITKNGISSSEKKKKKIWQMNKVKIRQKKPQKPCKNSLRNSGFELNCWIVPKWNLLLSHYNCFKNKTKVLT